MASRGASPKIGPQRADDYGKVYNRVLSQVRETRDHPLARRHVSIRALANYLGHVPASDEGDGTPRVGIINANAAEGRWRQGFAGSTSQREDRQCGAAGLDKKRQDVYRATTSIMPN